MLPGPDRNPWHGHSAHKPDPLGFERAAHVLFHVIEDLLQRLIEIGLVLFDGRTVTHEWLNHYCCLLSGEWRVILIEPVVGERRGFFRLQPGHHGWRPRSPRLLSTGSALACWSSTGRTLDAHHERDCHASARCRIRATRTKRRFERSRPMVRGCSRTGDRLLRLHAFAGALEQDNVASSGCSLGSFPALPERRCTGQYRRTGASGSRRLVAAVAPLCLSQRIGQRRHVVAESSSRRFTRLLISWSARCCIRIHECGERPIAQHDPQRRPALGHACHRR